MFYVLTCNGYTVEAEARTLAEAILTANRLEEQAGDDYCRVVSCDGTIIADADGPYPEEEPYTDAATQTGMYDR